MMFHDIGDREVPFAEGERLARAWPGARLRTLEGLGHNRPLNDAKVVRETLAFLANAGATGKAPRSIAARDAGETNRMAR